MIRSRTDAEKVLPSCCSLLDSVLRMASSKTPVFPEPVGAATTYTNLCVSVCLAAQSLEGNYDDVAELHQSSPCLLESHRRWGRSLTALH